MKIKKKKRNKKKFEVDYSWMIKITIAAFLSSLIFSFVADTIVAEINIFVGIVLLLVVISVGVIFDMIGISSATAKPISFNAMATKKIGGAKTALYLINNSSRVSSFCNDVVGDICGIISGSTGATIAIGVSSMLGTNILITSMIITAIITSLTIGGKAMFKSVAINNADYILFKVAKILNFYNKKKFQ